MNADWRVARWPILGISWVVLLASMALPVSWEAPFIVPLPYIPMGLVVLGAFSHLVDPTMYLLTVPLAFFVASPFLALRRPRGGLALIWVVMVLGLLFIWALPPGWELGNKIPGLPGTRGWRDFAFGFYVYAFAHTMAFVVCMLAPPGRPRPSRKRGFPVVLRSDQSGDSVAKGDK